jgi:hypothetical protein
VASCADERKILNSVNEKTVDSALLRWINEHRVPIEVDSPAYRALAQTIKQLGAPAHLTIIPKAQLVEGRWYVGRGRNANVALWCRVGDPGQLTFLTIGMTFGTFVVKDEGYYCDTEGEVGGCFQPFALIEEGQVFEPVGYGKGWDQHYAKTLELRSVFDTSVPYAVGDKVLLPDGQIGIITGTSEHAISGTVAQSKY